MWMSGSNCGESLFSGNSGLQCTYYSSVFSYYKLHKKLAYSH